MRVPFSIYPCSCTHVTLTCVVPQCQCKSFILCRWPLCYLYFAFTFTLLALHLCLSIYSSPCPYPWIVANKLSSHFPRPPFPYCPLPYALVRIPFPLCLCNLVLMLKPCICMYTHAHFPALIMYRYLCALVPILVPVPLFLSHCILALAIYPLCICPMAFLCTFASCPFSSVITCVLFSKCCSICALYCFALGTVLFSFPSCHYAPAVAFLPLLCHIDKLCSKLSMVWGVLSKVCNCLDRNCLC